MKKFSLYRSLLHELHRPIGLTTAFLLFSFVSAAAPLTTYFVATDQTGAQTQIDINHSSTWIITPTQDFAFGGGVFQMKDGQSTSANILLSLYLGTNASGPLLNSVTLTTTQFCAQTNNCGNYALHQFFLASPYTFVTGTTYFVSLTSTAPDTQSQAYFIKSDKYFISDQNGTPITPPPAIFGPPTPTAGVPEVPSLLMLSMGMTLFCAHRRWAALQSGANL